MRNVCFLFGINGVGKSTLARAAAERLPGLSVVSASSALRSALGGMTREALEALGPEEKQAALRQALIDAFRERRAASTVVCDTHLIVPIRREGIVRYERMWETEYEPFVSRLILVTASPADILRRRRADAESGVRSRDTDPDAIDADARVNDEEFTRLFDGRQEARLLFNEGRLEDVAASLLPLLRQ